ncbi:MAG: hypothetical protein CMJ72_15905 [Planctomycetaceae bacterium]|nr:hypothetical protein [Planctomycetaceae bacterium]
MAELKNRITRNLNLSGRIDLESDDFKVFQLSRPTDEADYPSITFALKEASLERFGPLENLYARLEVSSGTYLRQDFELGSLDEKDLSVEDLYPLDQFSSRDSVRTRLKIVDGESHRIIGLYETSFGLVKGVEEIIRAEPGDSGQKSLIRINHRQGLPLLVLFHPDWDAPDPVENFENSGLGHVLWPQIIELILYKVFFVEVDGEGPDSVTWEKLWRFVRGFHREFELPKKPDATAHASEQEAYSLEVEECVQTIIDKFNEWMKWPEKFNGMEGDWK